MTLRDLLFDVNVKGTFLMCRAALAKLVEAKGAIARMVPLGREQTPEDVAQAVLYLASAPNVTGAALNVAGGMEVW
jgi:NAD(P)-dependent dehydrogenase (short-subunit alcohol dehydrogenase family)